MNSIITKPHDVKRSFAHFLLGRDLLNLILAVYLGSVLQDFFNSLVQGAILPILMTLVPNSKYSNFSDIIVNVRGVEFKFGDIIMSTIKLFVGFSLSFVIVKFVIIKYLAETSR